MKTFLNSFFLIISILLISSCGSTKFGELGAPKEAKTPEKHGLDMSLLDALKREGSLQVKGNGQYAEITIRGQNSITLNTGPLYVLNGVVIGRDYNKANLSVVPSQIHSIIIKKSLAETAIYGEQGRNGVIEIRTKMNKDNKHSDKEKQVID